ncbi:VWA domain-containing protein [Parasedimentitalea maritima]|uniref:VWA domain-containing protein n=1 Tax=Parasedimentitalea maritima TaxID=2578117 RepID=A0A6A4RDL4_9RHOB|nr:VWA domain-containing protein [Zongyanglinia marina]KAE9625975.1 VWA domain-containing protein [Zongyanglinia marina]
MLTLAFPWALILLPLPWLAWRFMLPWRDRTSALRVPFFRRITEAARLTPEQGSVVLGRKPIQMIAAVLVWVLVVLGLARPEQLGEPIIITSSARDIVLALDISGSMDERDFQTPEGQPRQRLDAVKDVMARFIAERDTDRMSLIIFGSRAFVQAPFTEDLDSLIGFLDQTAVGMAGPQTALGDAIGLAIRSFETSKVDQRLVILLSDGADTSSRMTPVNAASFAAQKGVTISTIGVGDPEASGEGRVDLAALEDIAKRTGGHYFFADDQAGLEQIYAQIDAQNPRETQTQSFRPRKSLAHIPLATALLLILISLIFLHLRSLQQHGGTRL